MGGTTWELSQHKDAELRWKKRESSQTLFEILVCSVLQVNQCPSLLMPVEVGTVLLAPGNSPSPKIRIGNGIFKK